MASSTKSPSFGLCFDVRCLEHQGPERFSKQAASIFRDGSWEHPERIRRSYELIEHAGVLDALGLVPARPATRAELELVHGDRLLDRVFAGERHLGQEIEMGPGSLEAALLAAGGVIELVDAVADGTICSGYGLLRPPGHHATRDEAMGFCTFNSVAIAARVAQERGARRVAIVDWDVHHGNGTQSIFEADPEVLFVSLHQEDLYPAGSGRRYERGVGKGVGATVNVPLPAGSDAAIYRHALEAVVIPALEAFGPDFLLISAGQDAGVCDPIGRMAVTTAGFRSMAALLSDAAERTCGGRLVAFQEGGYSLSHTPYCTLAVVEGLAGLEAAFPDEPIPVDVSSATAAGLEAIAAGREQLALS